MVDRLDRSIDWTRRRLLTAGSLGLTLNLADFLRAESSTNHASRLTRPRVKNVIFLHQFGGPSHIDTFDMKPTAPDGIRGEFSPIATSVPGLSVCEHLPRWAKMMDSCAIVRSVHHDKKNHNSAGYYSLTGRDPATDDQRLRDSIELFPSFGSVVSRLTPIVDASIPSFVSFPHRISDGSVTPGQHASFLGKSFDPFFLEGDPNSASFRAPELSLPVGLSYQRLDQRNRLVERIDRQSRLLEYSSIAQGIDTFQERALAMLSSPRLKQSLDLSQEDARLRDRYGRTTYGQSCLLARRMVEAGVRFVTVYFARGIGGAGSEGWDTHQNNFHDLKNRLLPMSDQTVPTLLEDLKARGLLDETLVLWMGEFGRGPKIGDRDGKGRNHWPFCYSVLFAGGGVRGGAVFGASDRTGAFPSRDPVRPDDIAATLFWALGIDPTTEIFDATNRPLPVANGRPLTELFS